MNRYKLKETRRHSEAGSVDIAKVKAEQACIKELLVSFQPEDRWNMDKSALFAFATPDCGLAQMKMSRKKSNKFCITVAFACNSNGTEKKKLFFIGRSKKPQCFGQKSPITHGLYYCSNKSAWMTGAFFQE